MSASKEVISRIQYHPPCLRLCPADPGHPRKRIVLQIDNAGWHGPENLSVPDGIRLVFQPAHSPELQPAEHLWAFVDEPLANCCFATIESLDQAVSDRCVALVQQPDTIRDNTLFHWWPCQRAKK